MKTENVFKTVLKANLILEMRKHLGVYRDECMVWLSGAIDECGDVDATESDELMAWASKFYEEVANKLSGYVMDDVEVESGGPYFTTYPLIDEEK